MEDVPQFRPELQNLTVPERFRHLPIDPRGYPIPWFVYIDDKGVADFRIIGRNKLYTAVKQRRCWLCGEPLGKYMAFVIGPMCCINRISSEPPSHRECALFAVQACPFLTRPKMRRREDNLTPQRVGAAGLGIPRNPGVALVWVTTGYRVQNVPADPRLGSKPGVLFELGEPEEALWFAEGREATHDEVVASIDSGFPLLLDMAKKQGPKYVEELMDQANESMQYLPEKKFIEVARA